MMRKSFQPDLFIVQAGTGSQLGNIPCATADFRRYKETEDVKVIAMKHCNVMTRDRAGLLIGALAKDADDIRADDIQFAPVLPDNA